ncbi:MAG TPA: hypothetical protein VK466_04980, partial [Terriglobales bacterium]|nr:hypothetical protein [Terriglobales bacterium]
GYAWNHPHYAEMRQPLVATPSSSGTRAESLTATTRSTEPPLYTDEGRVLLVFNAPPRAGTAADGQAVSAAGAKASDDELAAAYRAFLGDYRSVSGDGTRVGVAVESGRLRLEVAGKFSSVLAASSQPNVWTCDTADCQVTFSTNAKAEVDRVKVRYAGEDIVAFRERSGMIF